jgi:hypothetical protein
VATMTSDVRAEMGANHALGCVCQLKSAHGAAARHHEQHLQLAQDLEIFDEVVKASTQLNRVYTTLAMARLLPEGVPAVAGPEEAEAVLELLHQSLESAKKAMDKAAEGEVRALSLSPSPSLSLLGCFPLHHTLTLSPTLLLLLLLHRPMRASARCC